MNKGWIKLHRCLLDKAFIKDPEKLSLWVIILMLANHKGREEMFGGKPIKCQPGQFTTGRKQLSEMSGIQESKVTRILEFFEKTEQQIEQQTSNKNRLITIKNWSLYQSEEKDEQQNEQQLDNNWTTTEHTQRTKELKKLSSTKSKGRSKAKKEVLEQSPEIAFNEVTKESLKKENLDKDINWMTFNSNWTTSESYTTDLKKYWKNLSLDQQQEILTLIKEHPQIFTSSIIWKRNFLKDEKGSIDWLRTKIKTTSINKSASTLGGKGLINLNNIEI